METTTGSDLTARYTGLSDRFRSLWTFYQFLGGVFKHQDRGALPVVYDFQALYKRVQVLLPMVGDGSRADPQTDAEFVLLEREIRRIHSELMRLEKDFPPSLLRGFFDHLKNQDEKILYALVKFYLLDGDPQKDTFDKLDILLTRLGQASTEGERILLRDAEELRKSFEHLAGLSAIPSVPPVEERALKEAIGEIRSQIGEVADFETLIDSRIVERFRELKESLGATAFHPPILIEVVRTNVELKNRFRELYREEEVKILEDTNRVFEIERYIERNPGVAHEDLRKQLESFRESRERFDAGRRENNVRRHDVAALRNSMQKVLETFEPARKTGTPPSESFFEQKVREMDERGPESKPAPRQAPPEVRVEKTAPPPEPGVEAAEPPEVDPSDSPVELTTEDLILEEPDRPGLLEILPPDPLLAPALHKIVFALELVAWDRPAEQAGRAKEIRHLRLEPWEVGSYLYLLDSADKQGTLAWELQAFLFNAAALRVKMEEEISELVRLNQANRAERLSEIQELASQSLERAREMDRRFRWFIDDMLFQGSTEKLEQVYRSHHRFLHAFSGLWLEHHAGGGVTPL